jgi:hypothetical protein
MTRNNESEKFVFAQVRRLGQLKNPPKGEEVLQDYATALFKADTNDIILETIDDFVFQAHDCPKIADLLSVIYRKNEARREESSTHTPSTGCKLCSYTGWIISYWLVTTERFKTSRQRIPQITDLTSERAYKAQMKAVSRPDGSPRQEVLSATEPCNCRKEKAA